MKKIFWDGREEDELVKQGIKELLTDDYFVWMAIARAQHALPLGRRRKIAGQAQVKGAIFEKFNADRRKLLELLDRPTAEAPAVAAPPPALEPVAPESIEEPVAPSTEEILAEASVTDLLKALAGKLGPVLTELGKGLGSMNTILAAVNNQGGGVVPDLNGLRASLGVGSAATTPEARRLKVAMLGFNEGERVIIKEKAAKFNLKISFHQPPLGHAPRSVPPHGLDYYIVHERAQHSLWTKKIPGNVRTVVDSLDITMKVLADKHAVACRPS